MEEFVSRDILEESYIKTFAPFHYLQVFFGTCRVDVRDQFVTAPTTMQKLYTVNFVLLVFMLYLFDYFFIVFRFIEHGIVHLLASVAFILHFGAYVYTSFNVRFMRNNANVKFYLKLHKIDRLLNINDMKSFNDKLYKYNLMTVLGITNMLGIFYGLAIVEDISICFAYFVLVITELTVSLDWLYFCNLVIFFCERLRFINSIMCSHINANTDNNMKHIYEIIFSIKKIKPTNEMQDFESSDTDIYLKKIFESLADFQYLFRDQMFLFFGKLIFGSLAVLEWSLLGLILPDMLIIERVALPLTVMLSFAIAINVCYQWEALFSELRKTKYLCTMILSIHFDGPLRRKTKRMLKAIEKSPPRFSVYGMWNIDLSFLFKIINLLTDLVVTVLQFFLIKI